MLTSRSDLENSSSLYWDAMAAITYVIGEKSCVSIEIVAGSGNALALRADGFMFPGKTMMPC